MFEIWLMILSSMIRAFLIGVFLIALLLAGVLLHDLWKGYNDD